MNGVIRPLIVLVLAIIVITSASAHNDENNADSRTQSKTKNVNYVAKFIIHYPTSRLCSNCYLNFATSLNWTGYLPENGLANSFRAYQTDIDTFSASVSFMTSNIGKKYVASAYYSAWSANATDRIWLSENCPNVLNNKGGNNKGREISFVLPSTNATYDVYPNFCYNEGVVSSFQMNASQLGGISKTVYYYVPGSLLDNPLPRQVNYILQSDGFAIKHSMKTTYDFAISHGIIPEAIVFGIGQGNPTDPWIDGGLQRNYEMTPYTCFVYPGGPPGCAPRSGAGFQYLDFLLNSALPYIRSTLGGLPVVSREYMTISGYSLGGLDACLFGYLNASVFSKAYCGSGSFWFNNNVFASVVNATAPSHPLKIYIDVGTREHPFITGFVPGAYQALLKRPEFILGVNLMYANYSNAPDSHQWNSWSTHTPLALSFLYNGPSDITAVAYASASRAAVVEYRENTRPFSMGATFEIPMTSAGQKNGANPQ